MSCHELVNDGQLVARICDPGFLCVDDADGLPVTEFDAPEKARRYAYLLLQAADAWEGREVTAPISHVTPEGVLRLTENVLDHLGLEGGGGVVPLPCGEHVLIVRDDQFMSQLRGTEHVFSDSRCVACACHESHATSHCARKTVPTEIVVAVDSGWLDYRFGGWVLCRCPECGGPAGRGDLRTGLCGEC